MNYPVELLCLVDPSTRASRNDQLDALVEEHANLASLTGHQASLADATVKLNQMHLEDALISLGHPVIEADSVNRYKTAVAKPGEDARAALQLAVQECEQSYRTASEAILEGQQIETDDYGDTSLGTKSSGRRLPEFLGTTFLTMAILYLFFGVWGAVLGFVIVGVCFLSLSISDPYRVQVAEDLLSTRDATKASLVSLAEATKCYEWRSLPVADYKGVIPVSVLRRGAEIKEALPEVELVVDYLLVGPAALVFDEKIWKWTKPELRIDPEPFLTVVRGEECAYIAVWQEPGFEIVLK